MRGKVLIIAAKHQHAYHWAVELNKLTKQQFHENCRYIYNESNLVGYKPPNTFVAILQDGGYRKLSADSWHRISILRYDGIPVVHVDPEAISKEFQEWLMTMTTETMST